jgi:hypothetical protein
MVINCNQKDNPSFDVCRSPRYVDATTNECKDLPTSTNEKGQPVVQVTKALCDSLPVMTNEMSAVCAGIKLGESVAVVLETEDETPPAGAPKSNDNPVQPAQSRSNATVFTDAPGTLNIDRVGGIAGCVGGAMASIPLCVNVSLIPGGGLVCAPLACIGGAFAGNKLGDIIYNITH